MAMVETLKGAMYSINNENWISFECKDQAFALSIKMYPIY